MYHLNNWKVSNKTKMAIKFKELNNFKSFARNVWIVKRKYHLSAQHAPTTNEEDELLGRLWTRLLKFIFLMCVSIYIYIKSSMTWSSHGIWYQSFPSYLHLESCCMLKEIKISSNWLQRFNFVNFLPLVMVEIDASN